MAIKLYTKQFAGMLPEIFQSKSAFLPVFGSRIQTITGAEADSKFLHLKVTDTAVAINDYSTTATVAFGTGTGDSNRFGNRKEVISEDVQVNFDNPLAIHEGVDRFTVNDIPEQVVAERLALHTIAWAEKYDAVMSDTIADKAHRLIKTLKTADGLASAFAKAREIFVNNNVSTTTPWLAYVTSEVYDILVSSNLTTSAKNADVNIGIQKLAAFKGFLLQEIPDSKFKGDNIGYFVAAGVGVAGVGIPVARTIDSEDFAGVAIQAAGKLGKYIPDDNAKAIIRMEVADSELEVLDPFKGTVTFTAKTAAEAAVADIPITIGGVTIKTGADGIAVFSLPAGDHAWTADETGVTSVTPSSGKATVTVLSDKAVALTVVA